MVEGDAHDDIGRPQGYQWRRLLADHTVGRSRRTHDGISRTGCHRRSRTRCFAPRGRTGSLDSRPLDSRLRRRESTLGIAVLFQFPAWTSGQVSATPSEGGPSVRFDITPEMIGRLQYNPNFALRLSEKWSEGVSGPLSVARNSDQWRVLLL